MNARNIFLEAQRRAERNGAAVVRPATRCADCGEKATPDHADYCVAYTGSY